MKSISNFLNKRVKIWKFSFSYDSILGVILLIVFILGFIVSPKTYFITTGRYNVSTEKDNAMVLKTLGKENTEDRFKTYFQWYNVIHELGHGMIIYNGKVHISSAKEEQLVNEFAVAYWRYYGEQEKLDLLKDVVDYAVLHIDGLDDNEKYMEYAEKHWNESSFMTFNGYGWFQFNSTKKALEGNKSLEEVLKEMGVKDFKLPEPKKLVYNEINEDVSTQIIDDAVDNFHSWGLSFPKVTHSYSNNPNDNYSSPYVKYYGLFKFPDIISAIKSKIKNKLK